MPNYTYSCENCGVSFELFFYIKDYEPNPKCINCDKKSNRLYSVDIPTQATSVKKSDSELKTLGDLAMRNTERLSQEQKHELDIKHNSYKTEKTQETPLPKGMKYASKPKTKFKWT